MPDDRSRQTRGTVYIAWDEGRYWGYWEQEPDGPPRNLEDIPESTSLPAVLAWGRDRAIRLIVRPEWDPGRSFWAGLGPPPDEELPKLAE
jgi:hypothetical protein